MRYWRLWKYKNLTFLFLSSLVGVILYKNEAFNQFLLNLGEASFLGAFLAGILFVSSFSVGTGAAILLVLAKTQSHLELSIIAGIGGAFGDFAIFRFIRNGLISEITPIYKQLGGNQITKILNVKYLKWLLPFIGAFMIASPFPDEIGIALMGISKIKTYQFVALSFILDTIGIFLFISAFQFKP